MLSRTPLSSSGAAAHDLFLIGALAAALVILGWIPVARAQGFSTSYIDVVPSAFGVHSQALWVRNVSTPVRYLVYSGAGGSTGPVRYATKTGTGAWAIDSSMTKFGFQVALAIPAASPYDPHIALMCSTTGYDWITYATRSGSTWSYEVILPRVASDSVVTAYAVGIGLSGTTPYVAYSVKRSNGNYELWLATRVSSNNWTREKVTSAVLNNSELAITDLNIKVTTTPTVHLSYAVTNYAADHYRIEHAVKSGSWAIDTVATAYVYLNSLALAGSVANVAYDKSGDLYWAYKDATLGWQATNLRPCNEGVGRSIALTLDGSNYPLIAYSYMDSVRYASKSTYGWNFQRVSGNHSSAPEVAIGFYSSGGTRYPQIVSPMTTDREVFALASGPDYLTNDSQRTGDDEPNMTQDGTLPLVSFSRAPRFESSRNAVSAIIALAEPAETRLELMDVGGRLVGSLRAGRLDAGEHALSIPLQPGVSQGVYFVQARTALGAHATSRVLLLR